MTEPNPGVLSATLHHIALESTAPAKLAKFYQRVMQLELSDLPGGIMGATTGRRLLFVPGASRKLAAAGFAVATAAEIEALRKRLEGSGRSYRIAEQTDLLYQPGSLSFADLDGNQMIFGIPVAEKPRDAEHLPARLQHFVVASQHAAALADFYEEVVGFVRSDDVFDDAGGLRTTFLRCSLEHHSFAVFQTTESRFDHHCYEAGDWGLIRDWADHFAALDVPVVWGPGRHGPGNNLFVFIHDLDGNWLEVSAELEIARPGRPVGKWPHLQKTLNQWGSAPLRS